MTNSNSIPIVFVHIGNAVPSYWKDTVQQARQWNPDAEIVCISEKAQDFGAGERWVETATIPFTEAHTRFFRTTPLDTSFRSGFWRLTTERLFVLEDWMLHEGVSECFHVENDNPLYMQLSEITPLLRIQSPGLSTPYHGQGGDLSSIRIAYSVFYVKSVEALSRFLFSLASAPSTVDEMARGAEYWLETPEDCNCLPTAPPGARLRSDLYKDWIIDENYPILFDAACHGQYLGGEDPRNGDKGPGYVNQDADVATDQFIYEWRLDEAGRRYPVLLDADGKAWRLVNLHIHCKDLQKFRS